MDLNKYKLTYDENTRTFNLREFNNEGEIGYVIIRITEHALIKMILENCEERSGWLVQTTRDIAEQDDFWAGFNTYVRGF